MSQLLMPRRGALGLMGGLAAASVVPRAATAAIGAVPAYDTPEGKLRALIMMRGALDDRLVIYWGRTQYYGLVEGEVKPLCGVVNACFSRYRPHPDGGYIAARGEAAFFTEFETDIVSSSIRNPYTGKAMQPPSRSLPPSPVRIQADSTISVKEGRGLEFRNVVQPVEIIGKDAILRESNMSKLQIPGGKPSLYNEMLTYRAKASDMANPDIKRPDCTTSVTMTVSWRSWMGMGEQPGHVLAAGVGAFVTSMDELPPSWVKAAAVAYPAMLKSPLQYLAPVWDSMK